MQEYYVGNSVMISSIAVSDGIFQNGEPTLGKISNKKEYNFSQFNSGYIPGEFSKEKNDTKINFAFIYIKMELASRPKWLRTCFPPTWIYGGLFKTHETEDYSLWRIILHIEGQPLNFMCMLSHSIMSDSLWPHGQDPTRLLSPWDFPGKNTGVGYHLLLQWIFPTLGSNPCLLHLLHWQEKCLPLCHLGSPSITSSCLVSVSKCPIIMITTSVSYKFPKHSLGGSNATTRQKTRQTKKLDQKKICLNIHSSITYSTNT